MNGGNGLDPRSGLQVDDTDGHVGLDRSAIRGVRASHVDVEKSAVGYARFGRGTIRQSVSGVVVGRSVACDEVRTGVLVSPVVRGEVHTLLDMRSAVAIGFGMVLGKAFLDGVRAVVRRLAG